jgi:asparagine synthase (glutamine-hydrolysing)
MCGIAGFLWCNGNSIVFGESGPRAIAHNMAGRLRYRGPDSSGEWVDIERGVALAHRRLAVLDTSSSGSQPMFSLGGRYCLSYNGEIYNFRKLRVLLEEEVPALSTSWLSGSDTEVMLAAFERWGIESAVKRFEGMFAFAVWDRDRSELVLVRDRLGEKPLYFGWSGQDFIFASEPAAFYAYPTFERRVDRDSIRHLMRFSCIPDPNSIFLGIEKLTPGHMVTIRVAARGPYEVGRKPYWSLRDRVDENRRQPLVLSSEDWQKKILGSLRSVVSQAMVADVPLGAFLSGGIDSSLIVALMQESSPRTISTFTIGYEDARYSEATFALNVARHLGTDHTELNLGSADVLSVIPKLPEIYCEPFADSSQIPTYLVSELARGYVTVALSGDGGDELFGGYNRYVWWRRVVESTGWLPAEGRRILSRLLLYASPRTIDAAFSFFGRVLPSSVRNSIPGERLVKVAKMLNQSDPHAIYISLVEAWNGDPVLGQQGKPLSSAVYDRWAFDYFRDATEAMQYLDQCWYLPNDILVKVDRASMANGLEVRAPFLDHSLVELSWALPQKEKINNGETKAILRRILDKYVPRGLVERPKMGFGVPIDEWLRGPLREWANELLDESVLRNEGIFDAAEVGRVWREHLSASRNNHHALWNVLMYRAWANHWKVTAA